MTLILKQRFVEDLLGSKGRVRILAALADTSGLNISQICRRVGMNHTDVNVHLEDLKNMDLITEKRYGTIRMFEFTFDEFNIRFKKNHGIDMKIITHS